MKTNPFKSTVMASLFVVMATIVSFVTFFPDTSYALSRADLGQPNPRANMYRSDGSITYTSSSRTTQPARTTQFVASGLSVSCIPTRLTISIGQPITWFASVIGGNGSYSYAWNGTEGLSGNTSSISKIYTTNGEKFATLSVTSGNQLITVSCGSLIVGFVNTGNSQTVTTPGFAASCYANPQRALPGESVTWLSIVSGTTASTTYAWDGTDGLSSDRPLVTKNYAMNGTKSALLTVTNGANRTVVSCTNSVSVGPRIVTASPSKPTTVVTTDIQGICVPSTTTSRPHDKVMWTVAAIGGNGTYEYLWSGDDALVATTASTTKTYDIPGTKAASVTVLSGGKTKVLTCPSIEVVKGWSGLTASSLFGWMNGPIGYLLALLGAIILAIVLARRKHAKEEEGEKDHEH